MKIERWLTRASFRLPRRLILRMAGGKPYVVGGRTLDPHLQLAAWGGRNKKKIWERSPEGARRSTRKLFAMLGQPERPGVKIQPLELSLPRGRTIKARHYAPQSPDPSLPLLVFFHMGGGVIGDLDICHGFCSILAQRTRGQVLSIQYRLAPQHPFPAGLQDATSAYLWACENKAMFNVNAVSVGGGSMGGNFAAVIAQQMREQGHEEPALQLLLYPALNMAQPRDSHRIYKDTFTLSQEMMAWFSGHYIPENQSRSDLRLSPLLRKDCKGIPPALIFTAGHDPLVEDGDEYAKQLADAGIAVDHMRFDSMAHGFTGFVGVSPGVRGVCEDIADRYRRFAKNLES